MTNKELNKSNESEYVTVAEAGQRLNIEPRKINKVLETNSTIRRKPKEKLVNIKDLIQWFATNPPKNVRKSLVWNYIEADEGEHFF